MERVTGIGGIFFRANDPQALARWYAEHLGVDEVPTSYDGPAWETEAGVTDFTQEPTDHFYGTDMGVRDPFGNPIRILQQGKASQAASA
jgi:hypothetical protein